MEWMAEEEEANTSENCWISFWSRTFLLPSNLPLWTFNDLLWSWRIKVEIDSDKWFFCFSIGWKFSEIVTDCMLVVNGFCGISSFKCILQYLWRTELLKGSEAVAVAGSSWKLPLKENGCTRRDPSLKYLSIGSISGTPTKNSHQDTFFSS